MLLMNWAAVLSYLTNKFYVDALLFFIFCNGCSNINSRKQKKKTEEGDLLHQ